MDVYYVGRVDVTTIILNKVRKGAESARKMCSAVGLE